MWDMLSEDHYGILQFPEDYTGRAVDGERIAGGGGPRVEGPRGRVRAAPVAVAWGENPRAVKCIYFTAMLLLGAAGGDGLRGRGRWGRGRRRRRQGEALVSDGLDD